MGDYGFDLGSFEDLDIADYIGGSYGGGFDFDLSSLGGNFGFDLSEINLGDLGLGSLDLGGLNFDIGGLNLDDIGSLVSDEDSDLINKYLSGKIDNDIFSDTSYTGTDDAESQLNYNFDLGSTEDIAAVDEINKEALADEFWKQTLGTGSLTDPYEIDGRQGSRTDPNYEEELKDKFWKETLGTGTAVPGGGTITTNRQGQSVIKYNDGSEKVISNDTNTLRDFVNRITGGAQNTSQLAALLGGLLALLGKTKPTTPGYKGGIPKYTAARVPGRGVEYTRAAEGGLMGLSAGGRPARYLRGGTDGMADKIKTNIDGKQPARLSHGEFVIPADVVSHLGNGNSDAGADVLYDMMAKVRKARTGTTKQGKQINPRKYTPA